MNLQSISVLLSTPELSKNKDRCFHRWVLFIYSTFETGIGFRRDHDSVGTRKKSLGIFMLVLCNFCYMLPWFRILPHCPKLKMNSKKPSTLIEKM